MQLWRYLHLHNDNDDDDDVWKLNWMMSQNFFSRQQESVAQLMNYGEMVSRDISRHNETSLNLFNLKCFDLLPLDKKSASHRELFFANQFQFQKTASKFFLSPRFELNLVFFICIGCDLSGDRTSPGLSSRARALKSSSHETKERLDQAEGQKLFSWLRPSLVKLESSSIVKSKLFKLLFSSD